MCIYSLTGQYKNTQICSFFLAKNGGNVCIVVEYRTDKHKNQLLINKQFLVVYNDVAIERTNRTLRYCVCSIIILAFLRINELT